MNKNSVLQLLLHHCTLNNKLVALLIDPDKVEADQLPYIVEDAHTAGVDVFFVGGSLMVGFNFSEIVQTLSELSDKPVIIFPGSNLHIDPNADAILLLSLISGRNPDLLIGQHVVAAPILRKSGLEIISTGYILVESGRPTTVSYISNSMPIPADKTEIAICTAMAGEMLGMHVIYMDAGSGAQQPISAKMIHSVKKNIRIPLIVGGGIDSARKAELAFEAGADIIVVGNAYERQPDIIHQVCRVKA
jgi:putative glycerol-1-phosphate prenyltransferase